MELHLRYEISVLLSFGARLIWLQKKEADLSSLSERDRIEYSCQKQDYSFLNYLAYVLYSPLYLAGPIISFNYYISQVYSPFPSLIAAPISGIYNLNPTNDTVWSAFSPSTLVDGAYITLHLCRRHVQNSCLARWNSFPTEYDKLL